MPANKHWNLPSSLACVQFLARTLRGAKIADDDPALKAAEEAAGGDSLGMLLDAAGRLGFSPEIVQEGVIPQDYSGPVAVEFGNGEWGCILSSDSLAAPVVAYWNAADDAVLEIGLEGLQQMLTGRAVIFRSLMRIDPSTHTGLYCLSLVARHLGIDLDERRMAHEYDVDDDEPSLDLLDEMSAHYGMRRRIVRMGWEKAAGMDGAYPVLCRKKSGAYFLLSGVDEGEQGVRLAVFDPAPSEDDDSEERGPHRLWTRDRWEKEFAGRGLLLQKRWKITEEEQPFGLAWFIPEFLRLKGVFAQIALAVVMMTLLSLLMPLFFQIIIDKVLPNSSFTTLNVLGIGITGAILFNCMLEFLRNYLLLFATKKIDVRTAMRTFAHLMRLPVQFFEAVPSGLLIKHMQQTEKIRGFLSGNLFFTVLDLFSLVLFIPFLMLYSVRLTGIVLLFSLLMALVIMALIQPFQRRLDILYQAEGKRQSRLVESLHGIHTVKALALEPVEERDWNDATAYSVQALFNVGKISLSAHAISQMLEMLMNVAVIWVGAHLVFDHVISIGALIAFQMLSGRVSSPLVRFVGLVHEYQQTALSVKMLGAVMNSPAEHPGGCVRQQIQGRITLEHVDFRYRDDLPPVLHDFSLDVSPGETIGIVGRSGSGKSTIVKLVQAMYLPQSGLVKIDGVDIREFDKAHLRRSIGVVLQENYFFHGSIRDNIRLTRRDASPEEVIQAASLAGAHEFVSKLPKGYDRVLEENGSNLSGGQRQRLAIARALLMNPPILIFDEATSALDPESEEVVKRNLSAIARGRTVIIVAHRLSMVRRADRILVIDKGAIEGLAP
ncbi:MAG: peptidase domain-containing ABC transporter, partial [Mailhella sp.]|nr:peptidase domain-containing ABC transporter [Mailhella sp.]